MIAFEELPTDRLVLRRPRREDDAEIFHRFASDPEVTRYLSWPRHQSLADTQRFLEFSDAEWNRWPAGPLLIRARDDGRLIGSTGYAFEDRDRASTGYVIARSDWGRGFATEALRAIVVRAVALEIRELHAFCHADHRASQRVLEKCGFERKGVLPGHSEFPNLLPGRLFDAVEYAMFPHLLR